MSKPSFDDESGAISTSTSISGLSGAEFHSAIRPSISFRRAAVSAPLLWPASRLQPASAVVIISGRRGDRDDDVNKKCAAAKSTERHFGTPKASFASPLSSLSCLKPPTLRGGGSSSCFGSVINNSFLLFSTFCLLRCTGILFSSMCSSHWTSKR
ncbi:hypothetical protein L596_012736 [Steinernema carpocapsae]|uniref:Uncharacterized protein n=1 Tax=Steinernema carpocapsae TaxID=34508 RepID=A0A4U5NY59_STECR|nr:hypothetical protein L596_012736 [Steinernema carpocapsae]